MSGSSSKHLIPTTSSPTRCEDCAVRAKALFQGIPLDQLKWTQQYRSDQFTVKKRAPLFLEQEAHPYAYTLFSGWLMLCKEAKSGKRQVLRFALPGDFIGFQVNLDGPMNYAAYAITDIRVCAFPRKQLSEMMAASSNLASRMATLNARDTELTQQLLVAASQTASQRLTSLLLQLFIRVQALKHLVPGTTENTIDLPLSQNMLADALSMSPETVNRTLRKLREQRVLDLSAKRLTILDKALAFEVSELDPTFSEEQALL